MAGAAYVRRRRFGRALGSTEMGLVQSQAD